MTTDGDVVSAKRALRDELLAWRRANPSDHIAAASSAVVAALKTLPELAGPTPASAAGSDGALRGLLLYAADPDEVSLDALITAPPAGWRVLLPRVEHGAIVPVPCPPGTPLATGHRGIREPSGDPVGADAVGAVVVPGVAFTPAGARLGRGAGMYDRLLPQLRGAVRIGVCIEPLVRDALPVETHDASVDLVVTDASVRRSPMTRTVGPA